MALSNEMGDAGNLDAAMRIDQSHSMRPSARHATGFTLVEILIVVIILGILAAIVIPQFSNASVTTKENALRSDLRQLRSQLVIYKAQHGDQSPGIPAGGGAADAATFISQLTLYTDSAGNVAPTPDATHVYGPYLSQLPRNPLNELSTVQVVSGGAAPVADGSTGWVYNSDTLQIIANFLGNDTTGSPYGGY